MNFVVFCLLSAVWRGLELPFLRPCRAVRKNGATDLKADDIVIGDEVLITRRINYYNEREGGENVARKRWG
jgi:hypothetical protein